MQRYFVDNDTFTLSKCDKHHVKNVMRMKDNDEVIAIYLNQPYLCSIYDIDREIKLKKIKKLEKQEEFIPKVRIIIPLLKEQKLDYIFQKATEMGVSEIIIYEAKRSMVKTNSKTENKLIRWNKILKEASEQSYRSSIPKLKGVLKIKELEKLDGYKFTCSTTEKDKNLKNVLNCVSNYDTINLVIGPEGGLEKLEEETLKEIAFKPISLGNRIMRVETVPLFVLSAINFRFME